MPTIKTSLGFHDNGKRFQAFVRHGESRTIAYCIDTKAPRDEQPAIVFCTDRPHAYAEAHLEATCRNRAWEVKCQKS